MLKVFYIVRVYWPELEVVSDGVEPLADLHHRTQVELEQVREDLE